MHFSSLRDFISHLEKHGELVRVSEPVSSYLEMTEIGTRLVRQGGPAVLFENVQSSEFRAQKDKEREQAGAVGLSACGASSHCETQEALLKAKRKEPYTHRALINLFGTTRRVAMGMGRKPEELRALGEQLAFLRQPEPPGGWKEALGMLPLVKQAMHMKPKTVSKAPCQEVVLKGDEIDLARLPVQTCWPGDAGPLITWPLVVTVPPPQVASSDSRSHGNDKRQGAGSGDPASLEHRPVAKSGGFAGDKYNLGIYRMQVTGKNTTLMRWLKHRGGAQHHARWKEQYRDPIPAAAVIGCDPATILAAVTPIPDTMSEYAFAGLLGGQAVELVDCKTIPLKVPANAEIVLEGHVSLDDYGEEGPFGDHTGYYNSVEKFPVFTISAITMRRDPIYLTTHTGKPPDEPSVLGEALNELFIPLLQQQFPEIIDFWLPPEGCSYRVGVVSIKKAYAGHGRRVMMGIWSYLRQFIYTKFLIVVDDDIDVRDWKEVIWAISTRMDPVRDTMLVENTPIDYLDFASPVSGLGGKMGMDATNKWPGETMREWGQQIEMTEDIVRQVTEKWGKYGFAE